MKIHQTLLLLRGQILSVHKMRLDQIPLTMERNMITIWQQKVFFHIHIRYIPLKVTMCLFSGHTRNDENFDNTKIFHCLKQYFSLQEKVNFSTGFLVLSLFKRNEFSTGSPGPESVSAAFPDQRSPCSRAGLMVMPVKKLGSCGSSCVHNFRA